MDRQFLVWNVIDPRAHDLAHQLTTRLAADRLGDHADRVLRLYEAERHRDSREMRRADRGTVGGGVDGISSARREAALRHARQQRVGARVSPCSEPEDLASVRERIAVACIWRKSQ